jgi:hypothetical protein
LLPSFQHPRRIGRSGNWPPHLSTIHPRVVRQDPDSPHRGPSCPHRAVRRPMSRSRYATATCGWMVSGCRPQGQS